MSDAQLRFSILNDTTQSGPFDLANLANLESRSCLDQGRMEMQGEVTGGCEKN